jgi:hypothetical protein
MQAKTNSKVPFLSPKRILLWAIIFALMMWQAAELRKMIETHLIPLNDFMAYWGACRIFISGGNPYDAMQMLGVQRSIGWAELSPGMMWNPPWTFPLLLPLYFVPYWMGREICLILGLELVLLAADWYWRHSGGLESCRWMSWLGALLFFPIGMALFLGQISTLVLIGSVGFLWAQHNKHFFTAGVFTLLIAIKPHLLYLFWIFLILWIIKEKRWRVLGGMLGSLSLFSLMALLLNHTVFLDYYNAVRSPLGPTIWITPTWGVALLMLFPSAGGWIRFIPSVLGMAVAVRQWFSWRHAFEWEKHWPVIALLSVTTSSFAWTFDWVVLLPVVILILGRFQAHPMRNWFLLFAYAVTQVLLIPLSNSGRDYFSTIWLPPALWLLYWIGSLLERPLKINDAA